ncbi:MAG: M48 family metallopeptidase [Pyrinomonadaceae bacterium]
MSTELNRIVVSGVRVEIVRKDIKNLHLGVYPPNGRVRVAAPLSFSNDAVRLAVIGKLGWIKRQQARFEAQPRQSRREMVGGESHYFLGRRYRLRVIPHDGPARIYVPNMSIIELRIRPDADEGQRLRALQGWYRRRLRELIPPLLNRWQAIIGVTVNDWGVKKMKTKWGSCIAGARRIWLNLELAKKPARCLEYLVVHELVHLLERRHNERFTGLMDKFLPQWRSHRDELNRAPLAHETWAY